MAETLTSAWDGAARLAVSVPGTAWVLLGAFLVFLMIPSIGMLEAGLTRRKNSLHGLMKSLSAAAVMIVIFTIVGFGLSFSDQTIGGIIGNPAKYLFGGDVTTAWPTIFGADGNATTGIPLLAYVLFQMMFAAVTLALIGAGVPERMKFSAWLAFSFFFSLVLYPLVAHLVWSFNGFFGNIGTRTGLLDGFGARDFAGGIVVHAQAGFAGLAVTLALGATLKKRAGAADHAPAKSRRGMAIPAGYAQAAEAERAERYGSSLPLAIIGTALLWFGWFGFNGASSLEMTTQGVSAAFVTAVAAATAGVVGMLMSKAIDGKYDGIMAVASVLGGLVMITPNSGYVEVLPAIVLGILAGVVTFSATKLMERYLYQVDDPVGGFPVHGVNGLLGSLLVPIFANQEITAFPVNGVLYAPGSAASWTWFALQAVTVIAVSALVFVVSFAFIKLLSAVMQVRATYEEEVVGLDAVDHGETTDLIPVPGTVGGSSQSVPARPTL